MTKQNSVYETHQEEINYLLSILDNHPKVMLRGSQPIMYAHKVYNHDKRTDNIKTTITALDKEGTINAKTSVLVSVNNNIDEDKWDSSTSDVKNFLSSKDIKSFTIKAQEGNPTVLVIDLAQDKLLPKLRKIYNEEVIPELVKNGRTEIIDPDGRDVTPKVIAAKRIDAQIITLLENAAAANIQPRELQEMFTRNKKKFEEKGNSR